MNFLGGRVIKVFRVFRVVKVIKVIKVIRVIRCFRVFKVVKVIRVFKVFRVFNEGGGGGGGKNFFWGGRVAVEFLGVLGKQMDILVCFFYECGLIFLRPTCDIYVSKIY